MVLNKIHNRQKVKAQVLQDLVQTLPPHQILLIVDKNLYCENLHLKYFI